MWGPLPCTERDLLVTQDSKGAEELVMGLAADCLNNSLSKI